MTHPGFPRHPPLPHEESGQVWTVRPFRDGDGAQLNALFNRVFRKDRPLDAWSWKFERHPARLPTIVTVATVNEQIIGMYPCVSGLWKVGEDLATVVQPVETAIEERLRGGRLILALHQSHVDRCEELRIPFAYGTPNEGHARMGRRRLGYVPLADLPVLRRDVNLKVPLIGYLRGPVRSMVMSVIRRQHRRSQGGRREAARVNVVVGRDLDPRLDELWARVSPSHAVIAVRTTPYLSWRYFQRVGPDDRICLTAYDGQKVVGYVILVLTHKRSQRIGVVADALSLPNEGILEVLLQHAVGYCAGARVDYVMAGALPHMDLYRALLSCGFTACSRARSVVCEPFSRADPGIFAAPNQWYLTLGDFDFDED